MLNRILLGFAGINGAAWLIISAWLVHGMDSYSARDSMSLAIACTFALIHTLLLVQLGFHSKHQPSRVLNIAGIMVMLGILLFSFIILFKVIWPDSIIAALSPLTPLGGLALISAWLLIALQGFYQK